MTQDHKLPDEFVKTRQNFNSKLDHVVEQQGHMCCHNTKQVNVSSQHHAGVSSPYMHQTQPPRADKFYAKTLATTGHNCPRHPSAITSVEQSFVGTKTHLVQELSNVLLYASFHNKQLFNESLKLPRWCIQFGSTSATLTIHTIKDRLILLADMAITFTFMIYTMRFTSSCTLHHQ